LERGINGVQWRLTKKFTRCGGIGIIFAMLIVRSESAGIRSKVPGGTSRKVLSASVSPGFRMVKCVGRDGDYQGRVTILHHVAHECNDGSRCRVLPAGTA